jgi:hypothetical protein
VVGDDELAEEATALGEVRCSGAETGSAETGGAGDGTAGDGVEAPGPVVGAAVAGTLASPGPLDRTEAGSTAAQGTRPHFFPGPGEVS